jgi:hypothetical protein
MNPGARKTPQGTSFATQYFLGEDHGEGKI